MRKLLSVFLMIFCILGLPLTALAATDTFSDVPKSHWSYEAIQQLAKANIIEGYGDGKYWGDRTITRYEMAVITANAMTKLDKADAQQKTLIDKLAKEYNRELSAIDVRLTKTEGKAKINFKFDQRLGVVSNSLGPNDGGGWTTTGDTKLSSKTAFVERIRIYMNVPVGDTWVWNGRLYQQRLNGYRTDSDYTATNDTRFDRYWVTGNVWGGKLELGKNWLGLGKYGFYANSGDTDSAIYSWNTGEWTYRAGAGRAKTAIYKLSTALAFAEFNYKPKEDKFRFGGFVVQQDGAPGVKDYRLASVNGQVLVGGGMGISFEYAKNYAQNPLFRKSGWWVALNSKYTAATYNQLNYVAMVDVNKVNDHGWGFSYRHLPAGVAGRYNQNAYNGWTSTAVDTNGSYANGIYNVNAVRLDYFYVPWKNVQLTLSYDHIKPIAGSWLNNQFCATFNYWF
jgi:hypothetical protein